MPRDDDHAPLLVRLGAAIIDVVLLTLVTMVAAFVTGIFKPLSDGGEVWLLVLVLVLSGSYSVGFELSPWRATPGLRWQGYRVAATSGAPIGLLRATVRWAAKVATLLSSIVGFLPVLFTARRQALHDLLSGTVVIFNRRAPAHDATPAAPSPSAASPAQLLSETAKLPDDDPHAQLLGELQTWLEMPEHDHSGPWFMGDLFRERDEQAAARIDAVLEAVREAVRSDASLVRAWYLRGCICVDLNRLDEAFEALAETVALSPAWRQEPLLMLGRAYVKKGSLPEAVDCYREAVRLAPGYAQAWYELGTTCERQGDTAAALAAFQEVLGLQPDHTEARAGILGLEPESTLASDAEWRVGDVVLDLYDVTGILGEGGMGRVYRVHHRGWGVDMAVKTPRPEIFARRGGKDDFVREAETWVDLGVHPNVVSCHYVRTLGGLPRVFAECVEGGTLDGWIDSGRLYEGGPQGALPRILDVAIQFAWGLQYAHEKGLVHQDVKPQNVLMTPDGTAKVADFGLARARGAAGEEPTPTLPGRSVVVPGCGFMTPQYCSPEQSAGHPLSRRTDIWSWGLSVLSMFTGGATWFAGQIAPEVLESYIEDGSGDPRIPAMPATVVDLLRQCFSRDPEQRPGTLAELAETLRGLHEGLTGRPYPRAQPSAAELTAQARNNQALSLLDLGKRKQADEAWDAALSADPLHPASTYNRGVLMWRRGAVTDDVLVTSLELVRAHQTDDPERACLLALVHLERHDVASAAQHLGWAAQRSPQDLDVQKAIATLEVVAPASISDRRLLSDAYENCLSVSDDGSWVLSGGSRAEGPHEARLWNLRSGQCVSRLAHPERVAAVAIDAHGRQALTACSDGVRLFDLERGSLVRLLKTGPCTSVSASGDWRFAAVAEGDSVSLWDLERGQMVWSAPHALVHCVALDSQGRWLLSAGGNPWSDCSVYVWDLTTGECVRRLKGHTDKVSGIALGTDGRRALSGAGVSDGSARLWDVATGVCLKRFSLAGDWVYAVALSADGRWAFTGSAVPPEDARPTLKIWDTATGRCLRTFEADGASVAVAGGRVVSGERGGLWVRDLPHGFPPIGSLRVSRPRSQVVLAEAEERANSLLADAQDSLGRQDVDAALSKLREARALPGWERSPRCLEAWSALASFCVRTGLRAAWPARTLEGSFGGLSADGRLALTRISTALLLWDIASGRCLRTLEASKTTAAALSPDGRWAITAGTPPGGPATGPYVLTVWDVSSGRAVRELPCPNVFVRRLSWSADGRWLLSGAMDGARLWAVDSGRCLRTFADGMLIGAVSFAPDGRQALLASGTDVSVWDCITGRRVRTWTAHAESEHPDAVSALCPTADGRRVLTGGRDRCARLWDLASGRGLTEFPAADTVESAVLSLDERYVFLGLSNKTIHVWDTTSGRSVLAIGTPEPVFGEMALAGGGRLLLAGGSRGVRVHELDWELETPAEAEWDEGARPYLATFLTLRTPVAAELSADEDATEEQIGLALSRRGRPSWTEADFADLRRTLGDAGYGWLSAEGVRRQLDRMAAERRHLVRRDGPMSGVLLRLVLIENVGDEPREMALGDVIEVPLELERPYIIGKAPYVDLRVNGPAVGKNAVRLTLMPDGVWVQDLRSGGGSSLEMDGAVTDRPSCRIRHGAVLRIGRTGANGAVAFRVELPGDPVVSS